MSEPVDVACLVFLVKGHPFAILSELVYRIERFEPANIEFKENMPAFYKVGDYIVQLDWLSEARVQKNELGEYERLILYRSNGKIRGIPAHSLVSVQSCTTENLSLAPVSFRKSNQTHWIQLFIINDEKKEIIPVLSLDNLSNFNKKRKQK